MRALVFVVILAVVGGAGYFFWKNSGGGAPTQPMFQQQAKTESPARQESSAARCSAQNAHYILRSDPRVRMNFAVAGAIHAQRQVQVEGVELPSNDPLVFVVTIAAKGAEYRFEAHTTTSGFEHHVLYPMTNGRAAPAEIQVSTFNANYDYQDGLPQPETAAPDHVFSADLLKWIYNHDADRRVDSPIGFFDFSDCVEAPAPAAPAPATP